MSLYIDVAEVTAILIAGEWYQGEGFILDAYEFHQDDHPVHSGGHSGISSTGFQFVSGLRGVIAGPLSSIQAVETTRPPVT